MKDNKKVTKARMELVRHGWQGSNSKSFEENLIRIHTKYTYRKSKVWSFKG